MKGQADPDSRGLSLLILSLVAVTGVVVLHWSLCFQAIQSYNALGNDSPYGAFGRPLPAPQNRSAFIDGDSYLWNQYAAAIAGGRDFRVRRNERDNAPFGREVHWSSGYSYLLAGSGWVWKLLAGGDVEEGIEKASTLVNPLIFIIFLATAGAFAARSFGYRAAVLLVLAAGGSYQLYWSFFPGKPDHHSLIAVSAFGTLACLVAGGGGWVWGNGSGEGRKGGPLSPPGMRTAGRWFAASAIFGAVGFWTSALTQSLVTAMIILAAAAASLFFDRAEAAADMSYRPELWRLWARIGAAAAVLFYLVEYFPGHLGMRIEVNHPLYALSWWGSGELLATLLMWRTGTLRTLGRKDLPLVAAAAGGLSVLPLLLWFGGDRYYSPVDPFFVRMADYILEQRPLGALVFMRDFGLLIAAALLSLFLLLCRRPSKESRFPLAMLVLCTAMAFGLTMWYRRWSFLLAVALVLLLVYSSFQHRRLMGSAAAGGVSAVLTVALILLQFSVFSFHGLERGFRFKRGDSNEFNMITFAWQRNIAEAIRADSGGREVTILSDPGTGLVLSYFGGFKGIGSLYWENIEGLKAAADIYAAETDAEAYRLVKQRGVTHIVLFRSYEPSKRFYQLKHGSYDPNKAYRTFGSKMRIRFLPGWLRRIPLYPTAGEFRQLDVDVFKVVHPRT